MSKLFRNLAIVSSAVAISGCSTMSGSGSSQSTVDKQAKLATKAQTVLQQQMSQADAKRIPNQLVADARCIAVFPSVIQAGFIVGGQHGTGLVTCRQQSGGFKAANPAVYSLSGGSVGLQAGAQKSSVVLLFMNRQSVDALLQSNIKFGSQITATAGPTGYNHAITRAPAPVVAYATSQNGLYAGINLTGSKMSFGKSANASVYGASPTPEGVLLGDLQTPDAMSSFKQTLQQFAPTGGPNTGGGQQQSQSSGSSSQTSGGQQPSGDNQSGSDNSQQQTQQAGSSQQPQSSGSSPQTGGGQQSSGNNQSTTGNSPQQSGANQAGSGDGQFQPNGNSQ